MPIPHRRMVVLGVKKAQQRLKLYWQQRLEAEREAKDGLVSLQQMEADLQRVRQEADRG